MRVVLQDYNSPFLNACSKLVLQVDFMYSSENKKVFIAIIVQYKYADR